MDGLMTLKRLITRAGGTFGLAAVALATLIFLSASQAPTSAQGGGGAGKVSMNDVSFAFSVGVAPAETLRVSVFNALMLDGSVRIAKGHIRVFSGATGAEVGKLEFLNPPAGLHTFDIGGSGRDILIGGSGTDRIQLWVEVILTTRYETRTEQPGAGIFAPTFELIDDASGKTTAHGTLAKAGPGTLLLSGTF